METQVLSKRIRNYRQKNGLSQEQLAEKSGLNLRTIQRIEKDETIPRGDSLRRLAIALKTSPDDLIDWRTKEDKNLLTILNLSQLSFIAFPTLGILIPLIIWILQKDKIKKVDQLGKLILNFQLSWTLIFFLSNGILMFAKILHLDIGGQVSDVLPILFIMYGYNILVIVLNSILCIRDKTAFYKPAIRFLS